MLIDNKKENQKYKNEVNRLENVHRLSAAIYDVYNNIYIKCSSFMVINCH